MDTYRARRGSNNWNGLAYKIAWYGLTAVGFFNLIGFVWALVKTDAQTISDIGWGRRAFTLGLVTIPYGTLSILAGIGVRFQKSGARWLGMVLTGLGGFSSIASSIQAWTSGLMGSGFQHLGYAVMFAVVFVSLLRLDVKPRNQKHAS